MDYLSSYGLTSPSWSSYRKPDDWVHRVYGESDQNKRKIFWALLKKLSDSSTLPWLCMGDYNEVLHEHEKEGRCDIPQWRMIDFRNALSEYSLVDLGVGGSRFTWSKVMPHTVQERVDRVVQQEIGLLNSINSEIRIGIPHVQIIAW
ncbi:hypothetical protein Salat_1693900 [Sesamum alatum]|uniref:Endonuclease/exonuclease/phosphatase domain-containing protein n=1 Tax=Sesamum alatum TaxID=300844 RepID=A0AAE1Y7A8_9LAMI|nr:hypothetical protein Salat_1693900 [Sesamum alatum]